MTGGLVTGRCRVMSNHHLSIRDLVRSSVAEQVCLPEWRLDPDWSDRQVKLLADSLYREFVIGTIVLGRAPVGTAAYDRHGVLLSDNVSWVVDGRQRISAMCVMFGVQPCWRVGGDPGRLQFEVNSERFRIVRAAATSAATGGANGAPELGARRHPVRAGRPGTPYWVDVADVMNGDEDAFVGLCDDVSAHFSPEYASGPDSSRRRSQADSLTALGRLRRLQDIEIRTTGVITVELAFVEDAAEMRQRLQS